VAGYVGKPSVSDLPAEYRMHAALVSDGERPRPTRALLVEFDANGIPVLYVFGPGYNSHREAITELLDATKILNAEASN
jgi:hypothetical protein